MRTALRLSLVFAYGLSLHAQVTASLNRFRDRSPEIAIRNDSAMDLTAFAVAMAPAAGGPRENPLVVFVDSAIDADRTTSYRLSSALPIAPNREFAVPVPTRMSAGKREDLFDPPIAAAAVFSDGTAAGDPDLLARLLLRRRCMLQAVELVRDILTNAGGHNVPRTQLTAQLGMIADSVSRSYLPPEQQVGRNLYGAIRQRLTQLPEPPLGSPFPPTAFVEQETAMLNRQRALLLEAIDKTHALKKPTERQ